MLGYDKSLREGLQVLLYHIEPSAILDNWQHRSRYERYQTIPQQFPYLLSRTHPEQFSIDDAKHVRQILQNRYEKQDSAGIFSLILDFSCQTLVQRELLPLVRYDQILRWRHTTQNLGSLPFACAFLAHQDQLSGFQRQSFCLNPVLQSDNRRLQQILNKGMAENHFHLKGSSRSAFLSWVCLMNDVMNRAETFSAIGRLQLNTGVEPLGRTLYVLVLQAAAIRAFLFSRLESVQTNEQDNEQLHRMLCCEGPLDCQAQINTLQAWINGLRLTYGRTIQNTRPDYAIQYTDCESNETSFLLFSGEYSFQYHMFQAVFRRDPNILPYLDLFYAYLIISIRFRSELVQCNDQIGFQNFNEYDSRKGDFLKGRAIFETAYTVGAAAAVLQDPRIHALEVRIVPKQSVKDLSRQIEDINSHIQVFFPDNTPKTEILDRICYVLHIPKHPDTLPQNKPLEYICCRDVQLRSQASAIANALIRLRDSGSDTAYWIKGIDACANEADTRPEVFAEAYRRLKAHQPRCLPGSALITQRKLPMLHVTYHVGEDFFDIADGLRAIWEAITFLELDRLDRVGHGLALGINPEDWYTAKQYRVYLSRQALLDNCAWMLYTLGSHNGLDSSLKWKLEHECAVQYAAIYQSSLPFPECESNFDLSNYVQSMELRGDDPNCYLNYQAQEAFVKNLDICKGQAPYCLRNDETGQSCHTIRRHNIQAIRLYHHYHYNPAVKRVGEEVIEFHVSKRYVRAVEQLQIIMQNQIARLGIGIETNPSSNVLIGSFKRYDKHPLIAFNDCNLFDKPGNPNLFVSINTDDQGVFDTCLENEYALMARSLEQLTDGQGLPVVSSDRIYQWLDHIRQMGLEQSFLIQ